MTTPTLRHEMLVANAGSGKTHRLTVRTITLLGLGIEPDKIAALTFTKKAAGEFVEAVFTRLARAAESPADLGALQADTGLADLDAERCRGILARLVSHLHRLSMGTIDSLFGRIARSFPLESGLSGEFALMGETGLSRLRRDVLAEMFRGGVADEEKFAEFLDVVRRQSRRESERSVFETLLSTAGRLHENFLRTPPTTCWGDRRLIWPAGSPVLAAGEHRAAADHLREVITASHPLLSPEAKDTWEANLEMVKALRPGQSWPKLASDFIKGRLVKFSTDKKTGEDYVPTGRAAAGRVYLTDEVRTARQDLLLALFKMEIEALLVSSAALYRMMARFEEVYARAVRGQGFLTFSDVTEILAAQVDDPAWRAAVGYRMDSRFDHWLLDEFQDTSRLQWRVLGALIDEVIQDGDGRRSFFYVGDIKQAIYSWRGGDPALFFEIQRHYNQAGEERIRAAEPLSVSYRSAPEIIEVVNQVFEDLPEELALPEQTVAEWRKAWVRHGVAERNAEQRGYVYWKAVDAMESEEEEEASPQDAEILRILLEVQPWERGWSCAALKRDNKKVEGLAALLQAHGIPVAIEGKANPCSDNPLGAALLAVFRWMASPEDKLSRVFVLASPFGAAVRESGAERLRQETLLAIADGGFGEACRYWLEKIDLSAEPFLRQRANDFLAAAGDFDAMKQAADGIGEFLHHLETFQRQEPEGAGRVRIMTIHQSKGLTLDMVIVSGLDALAKDRSAGSLALSHNEAGAIWGLVLPKAEVAEADEVLRGTRNRLLAESTYGELCAAYVAMTRPRHGLYVVTNRLGENSTAKGFARLLGLRLGQVDPFYAKGDAQWFEQRPLRLSTASAPAGPLIPLPRPLQGTPHALSPSRWADGNRAAEPAERRSLAGAEAAALGNEIHRWLANREWDGEPNKGDELSPEAQRRMEQFLQTEDARQVFTRPAEPCQLWREQAFDLLLDGQWVSGVFDRVQIITDETGQPQSAVVYDFKTDRADAAALARRYGEQLAVYRSAAAQLLGLSLDTVTARVVAVRS